MGVIDIFFVFGDVLLALVLHVETGTETQDDHLVARLGALVDGDFKLFWLCRGAVEEYWILGGPRSERGAETLKGQAFPLPIFAVIGHQPVAVALERAARHDGLVRAIRQP